ncbi:MAG: hypothetical protein A4E57_00761 [Syntrophorhabdaceae bacterium PtaU1.Bin034]|nr:MAG: hypothetical protein A4E57_00761 [Syntrophorhabdaceae bacterium PtaU1.Bin034]
MKKAGRKEKKSRIDSLASKLLVVHAALLMFHRNGYVFQGIWDHVGTEPYFESLAAPIRSFVEEGSATIDYLYVRLTITDGREFVICGNVLPIHTPFFILDCSVRACTPPSLELELSKVCEAFSIPMTPLGANKYILHPFQTMVDWTFAIGPLRQKLVDRLVTLYLTKSRTKSKPQYPIMEQYHARGMLQARKRLIEVLRLMHSPSVNRVSTTEGANG